ncbi:MAG: 50S ribosomal protein L21 [Chthonomonadales bacterium]|nr:50S ribosomal protein L21 [Chthonomonadales bacterium]
MYAIVRSGGKQYKVAPNAIVSVEKVEPDKDGRYTFEDVLLVCDDTGVRIGTPRVPDAAVQAEVIEQYRGKKVRGFTYKPTKNIQRHYGHRQSLTRVRVVAITTGQTAASAPASGESEE